MSRSRSMFYAAIGCLALCAVTVVHITEQAFDWLFGLLPVSPPRLAFAGDLEPTPAFSTFADPGVQRHEAGLARLGAVRHR